MLLGKGIMSTLSEKGGLIALYDTKKKNREILVLKVNKGDNINYNATMNILKPILKEIDIYKLVNLLPSMRPQSLNNDNQCEIRTIRFNGAIITIMIDGNRPTKSTDVDLTAIMCYTGSNTKFYSCISKGVGRSAYKEYKLTSQGNTTLDLLKVLNECAIEYYGYLLKIKSPIVNTIKKITYLNTPVVKSNNSDSNGIDGMKYDIIEILEMSNKLTDKINKFKNKYKDILEI